MYLQMKLLKQLRTAWVLPLLLSYSLYAGDKIITSNDKLQGGPTKDLKMGNDLLKSRVKIDDTGADLGMPNTATLGPVPLSRKERQILKDRQAEQKNWLLLEPGELQRKHEQESSMGVENNPINRLGGDDARNDAPKDYTFYKVGEKKAGQRQPGEIRSPGQKQSKEEAAEANRIAEGQRAREEADEDSRRAKPTFDLSGSTEAQPSHMSSELNFSKLLQPDQKETISAASASKGEFSWGSLTAPTRSKEQQARTETFNNLISGQPQGPLSLPVTAGPSLTPTAPGVVPRPPDVSATRAPDSSFNGFSPSAGGFNANPGGFNPSALPTFNNNPGFNPASPFQPRNPSASDSSRNWLKPVEPMRRQF